MPDLKDDKLPSRDYVINVGMFASLFLLIVNTLLPDELQEMVEKVKAENEERYINKRSLNMKVLPELQGYFLKQRRFLVGLINNCVRT